MSLSALAGLVLALALLVGLHFRVTRLPLALATLARRERAQDGGGLIEAMKEAVATRAGQAVIALQTLQEHLAQSLRIQIAEAETRARMAERRAADTTTALEAASTVLRELRATLEAASEVTRELRALRRAADKPSTRPVAMGDPQRVPQTPPVATGVLDTSPITRGDPQPPRGDGGGSSEVGSANPSPRAVLAGCPPTEDWDDAERKTWEMASAPINLGYSPRPPPAAGYSARPPPAAGNSPRPPPAAGNSPRPPVAVGGSPRPPAPEPPASRVGPRTGASPAPEGDDGGFDDEDEMTRVADRGRDLSAFRAARRAPTLLPPAPARAREASPPSSWRAPPGPRTSGGEGAR